MNYLRSTGFPTESDTDICPCCGRNSEPSIPARTVVERLLKLSEIAEILNIPLSTLRRAAKRGDFPTYVVAGGHRRARLSEVIRAIETAQKGGCK